MENIIINEEIATKELKDKIEKEIRELELEHNEIDLMNHYQYLYNIAWMKLYALLNKHKKDGEKREGN